MALTLAACESGSAKKETPETKTTPPVAKVPAASDPTPAAPPAPQTQVETVTPDEPAGKLGYGARAAAKLDHVVRQVLPRARSGDADATFATTYQDVREARERKLADLRKVVADSRPVSAAAALAAVDSDGEVPRLIAEIASAPDPQAVDAKTHELVEEIFNEYGKGRGKMWQFSAAVFQLYNHKLYTRDVRERMAYASALIFQQAKSLRDEELFGSGVYIVATSALLGGAAGLAKSERAQALLEGAATPRPRSWAKALATRAAAGTERVVLSTPRVVERNLRALGLSAERVRDLGLHRVKGGVGEKLELTNMPEMGYARKDGLVFTLTRPERGSNTPEYIATRPLADDEAQALIQDIAFNPLKPGFLAAADGKSTKIQRLTEEQMRETEARIARAGGRPPSLRYFDKRWATGVGLGTLALSSAFFYQGFGQGDVFGVLSGTLYVENMIPPEALSDPSLALAFDGR